LLKEFGLVKDGLKMLEVGTGWIHFYGLFPLLFAKFQAVLLDIWDCRQFGPFQTFFAQLYARLETDYDLTEDELIKAKAVLVRVLQATSFTEVYKTLGAEYIVDPSGINTLVDGNNTFDLIISFHVLEHVRLDDVQHHLASYTRLLKSGGFQIHQIGISDHLAHYDKSAHVKAYLQYSDRVWRRWFENDLQYFNRIQLSEWLRRFQQTGMRLMHFEQEECDVSGLQINPTFAHLEERDLKCTIPTFVLQKG
jgi:hypothetical protein